MLTLNAERLAAIAHSSLAVLGGGGYEADGDAFRWHGRRPGPDWHGHGWTASRPFLLVKGRFQRCVVLKHRWRKTDRSATVTSQPPDLVGFRFDLMIVALELWCWLDAALGLHRYTTPFDDGPSRRTVQRWLHRALPRALKIQSAIRRAVIERCEPRPMEAMFQGGLSPPEALLRRAWRSPSIASTLWQGLAMLHVGAEKLGIPTTTLLAEARGRQPNRQARSRV